MGGWGGSFGGGPQAPRGDRNGRFGNAFTVSCVQRWLRWTISQGCCRDGPRRRSAGFIVAASFVTADAIELPYYVALLGVLALKLVAKAEGGAPAPRALVAGPVPV